MSDFKLRYLITTGAREAEMIEALLNDNQIEVIVRHDETGDYTTLYMGFSAFNIELYVAEKDYEKAKELLEDLNLENTENLENAEAGEEAEQNLKNNKKREKSISFYLAQIAKIIIILFLLFHLIPFFF